LGKVISLEKIFEESDKEKILWEIIARQKEKNGKRKIEEVEKDLEELKIALVLIKEVFGDTALTKMLKKEFLKLEKMFKKDVL